MNPESRDSGSGANAPSRNDDRERPLLPRHCERKRSNPSHRTSDGWIASSLTLLAMTDAKTKMPGTSSAKTRCALLPGHDDVLDVCQRREKLRLAHQAYRTTPLPA